MTTDTNTTAPRFTVTLAALRKAGACYDGYNKLVRSLQGQPFTEEDEDRNSYIHFKHDAEIPLVDVLNRNGLDDAMWTLRCVSGADRDLRLFAVWCARQVEHLMQDQRSKDALDVAERFANGEATEEDRDAARAAARAAAWDAWDAARAAARAARDAARAAGDAARAAGDAARDAQTEMFKRMCLGTAPWQQGKVAAGPTAPATASNHTTPRDHMNKINDGGPAFPLADAQSVHRIGAAAIEGITDSAERDRLYAEATARACAGMTLRDYFAAKALQGLLADPSTNTAINSTDRDFIEREQQKFADLTARAAYRMADAMLRARGEA